MAIQKWFIRILIGLLLLVGVLILTIAGIILYDVIFPSQQVADFTNVSYQGPEGITLRAYYTQPEGEGPYPGVLLVHEFYGINADIVRKADILADNGYAVLAVDAYRGKTTSNIPRAIFLVITTPQDQINADIDAGFEYLETRSDVAPARIGAVGFCFGGTQVMYAAIRNPDLAASVIFYGSGPITDPAQLGVMDENGPVLGIYGQEDQSIPVSQVRAFEQAMNTKGVSNKVSIYPGVGHAFVNTETIAQPGPAQEAWEEMLAFLNETLIEGSSAPTIGAANQAERIAYAGINATQYASFSVADGIDKWGYIPRWLKSSVAARQEFVQFDSAGSICHASR